ncbi:MAG: hypothetical protein JWM05_3095, partial [Acidimicrobiales bacterium]|nr:hypothetical protein [Acidimicrobiales bacterium]
GLVDAYFGPVDLKARVEAEPERALPALVGDVRALVADLDAGDGDLSPVRRAWLRGQATGLHTVARKLDGAAIGYRDEVESCYGVRPERVPEDVFSQAHHRLDEALPGSGPIAERLIAWRESHAVPVESLEPAIRSLADDFRERTDRQFGLPEGEHVEFLFETDKPWSGFNYYEGGLRSRVAINVDLPVLSTSLGHLVAHEAYPGHHTEHTRKEVGLVRRRGQLEESIFLVGTPQCLLAEGLADLGLEVLLGERPEPELAAHLAPLGIRYDTEVVAAVATAGEALATVRGNVALLLHEDGADVDDAVAYLERWSLLPRNRAEKAARFLTDPTWKAYIFCYVAGLPLCRSYVAGNPSRFERLLTDQLVPSDLAATSRRAE